MNRAEAKAAALGFCNAVRADQGRPRIQNLPPGSPKATLKCPIANATGLACDGIGLYEPTGGLNPAVFIPPAVRRFIELFDSGQYPELVKGE